MNAHRAGAAAARTCAHRHDATLCHRELGQRKDGAQEVHRVVGNRLSVKLLVNSQTDKHPLAKLLEPECGNGLGAR